MSAEPEGVTPYEISPDVGVGDDGNRPADTIQRNAYILQTPDVGAM